MRPINGTVYVRRPVPRPQDGNSQPPAWAGRLVMWLGVEFNNVARALAGSRVQEVTSDYTAQFTDAVVLADATTGAVAVTLPAPVDATGVGLTVKKVDASANAVTIVGTVDGVVNPTLAAQYDAKTVYSSGTAWYVLATV